MSSVKRLVKTIIAVFSVLLLGLSLSSCSAISSLPNPVKVKAERAEEVARARHQAEAQNMASRINSGDYPRLSATAFTWTNDSWDSWGDVEERPSLYITRSSTFEDEDSFITTNYFVVEGDMVRLPDKCMKPGVCGEGISPRRHLPMSLEQINDKGWL